MTETFNWPVTTDSNGGGDFVVASAQFGDGYKQESPLGINNEIQNWNVTFTGTRDEAQEVLDFIRDHQGATPFFWTPPLGVEGYYTCKSYKGPARNGIRYRLAFQFEQTYLP